MRLDKVDLNLFIVFDAIYRERSVTKVAQILNLTQPAVSNALSRLRQTFDDQLFVRTPEGMAPTPVADNVIADVKHALHLLADSVGSNARFDPLNSNKVFRLGMNDLAEALLLPKLRMALRDIAPHIAISSYYVDRVSATEELKAGTLDLLLDSSVVNAKDFEQRMLGQLSYVGAVRKGHPLAKKALSLDDYVAAEHVHVSSRRKGRGQVDVALHALGHKRAIMMRVQSYLVAAKITEQTDLVWTAPKVVVDTTPLYKTALSFAVEPLTWHLYWHKSADNDPANVWMRGIVATLVAEILG